MSDILLKQLNEKYPPIGPHNATQLSIYPYQELSSRYIERIYLDVLDLKFIKNPKDLITMDEMKDLAESIFDDIDFEMKNIRDEGYIVEFKPHGISDYLENYSGHAIIIREPFSTPHITISTGNRGSIGLNDRQREKYFNFVNGLYDIFVENLEKNILQSKPV
ncbi:MAG: hypothetical protein GQ477_00355 [Nanohaloarchaea archaeon]|nr:hypothetical protein [Candidatus Nanohaloarchaea archaeon]